MKLNLNEADLKQFQDFFYNKTGIVFGPSKRYFVERRLLDRMAAGHANSVDGYLRGLANPSGSRELQQLINSMTVNETYFFRETYQFDCLTRNLLPELTKDRSRGRISIWSLPCATGEEPYSVALWMLENWAKVDSFDVSITGSDIDTKTLSQARTGIYDARSLQHVSQRLLDRYFKPLGEGRWQVIGPLRDSVDFTSVNLVDPGQMVGYRDFDVIFCRNLLIYFDDASRRLAAEQLFQALRPGGYLCLGHSESMSRISELFTVRKYPDGIVYQKPV